jgi:multiple sugar transport system permease protein
LKIKHIKRISKYTLLIVCVLILAGPVFLVIVSSFKYERDIFTRKPVFFFQPHLENYRVVFKNEMYVASLKNSLIVSSFSILLTLAVSLPIAYAYSRYRYRGIKRTALVLVGIRMFPPIIISIPLYPIAMHIGLVDNPTILILLNTAFQCSMTTLLLKVFIDAVSTELDDAAMIDGCSRLEAFYRIIFPIIAPGIISASIFVGLYSWNDFLFPFLFTNVKARTVPVMIGEFLYNLGEATGDVTWGSVFAACSVHMVPILLFIWAIQKRLLSGFTLGAVKG